MVTTGSSEAFDLASERLDARVVRTRDSLRTAALDLVAEAEWNEISVTDITKRARVSRPTFYLHYASLDELAADALIEQIRASADAGGEPDSSDIPGALVDFLREVNQHRVVYRRMIGARSVAGIAREMVAGHLAERLVQWRVAGADADESAQFIAGGILGFLSYWLRSDETESSERVLDTAHRLWAMIRGPRFIDDETFPDAAGT